MARALGKKVPWSLCTWVIFTQIPSGRVSVVSFDLEGAATPD